MKKRIMSEEEYAHHQARTLVSKHFEGVRAASGVTLKTKYRNTPTITEHGRFDSKKEAARFGELVLLERAGKIKNLRCQVKYALVVNAVHICDYIADVVYEEGRRVVVEDTKSEVTRKNQVYRIKKKLMDALWMIQIKET